MGPLGVVGVGPARYSLVGMVDAIVARGVGRLTVIANDTASPGKGIGKLGGGGIRTDGAGSRCVAQPHPLNREQCRSSWGRQSIA